MSNDKRDWVNDFNKTMWNRSVDFEDLADAAKWGYMQGRSHQPQPPPVSDDVREVVGELYKTYAFTHYNPLAQERIVAITNLLQSFLTARDRKQNAKPSEAEIQNAFLNLPDAKAWEEMKHELFGTKASEKLNAEYARGFELELKEAQNQTAEVIKVLEQANEAFLVAFNTVECNSIDDFGNELPWYKGAKAAHQGITSLLSNLKGNQ